MPNSLTTRQAVQWLETGKAPVDRIGAVARALALLSGEVPLDPVVFSDPFGADIELAMLTVAETKEMYALVKLIRDHAASKVAAKQAKKLIFRARQRGLQIEEGAVVREAVSLAQRPEPLPSYCTSFDSTGMQVLLHGGWSRTDGAFCIVGFVSDRFGLQSTSFFAGMSKTRQREVLAGLQQRFHGLAVVVEPEFSAGRMRWALDVSDELGRRVKGDVRAARRLLEEVEPIAEIELNIDLADEAEVETRIESGALLVEEPCYRGWLPLGERPMDDILRRVDEAVVSDEALTGDTLEVALGDIKATFVAERIDAKERDRMANRMELTAWLLARDGRREAALRSVSTARALRDTDRALMELPFVRASIDVLAPTELLVRWVGQRRQATTG
jgi:hypothetical protein